MKNVLLPTDFSENSWNAIKYALKFFETSKCDFYLLHVNKPSSIVLDDSLYTASHEVLKTVYAKPIKQHLQDILKRISQQFSPNKNHRFYTLNTHQFFIESIRDCVEEKKIDLIVMGTKGASGLEKIMVGTNTADVITKVKCTTLIIPENARFVELKEIAFPTDFSLSYNIEILQPIYDVLENYGSALRIVHINKKVTSLNGDQKINKELLEDYFNNHRYSFHYLTSKKVEDAIQSFVEFRNTDMICMVAKNLNYFQQILFHSKVKEISYHTDVPFLVLHEKN